MAAAVCELMASTDETSPLFTRYRDDFHFDLRVDADTDDTELLDMVYSQPCFQSEPMDVQARRFFTLVYALRDLDTQWTALRFVGDWLLPKVESFIDRCYTADEALHGTPCNCPDCVYHRVVVGTQFATHIVLQRAHGS